VKTSKPAIAISLLIIALGVAWLLNTMHVIPGVDWIWVGGLGVSGILLLALAKLDRFNFVVGTSLVVCSILSVLRQTKVIDVNIELPVLFICVGVLLLFAHLFRIPSAAETAPPPPPSSQAPASTNETQL
jgi:hypothetical protein